MNLTDLNDKLSNVLDIYIETKIVDIELEMARINREGHLTNPNTEQVLNNISGPTTETPLLTQIN